MSAAPGSPRIPSLPLPCAPCGSPGSARGSPAGGAGPAGPAAPAPRGSRGCRSPFRLQSCSCARESGVFWRGREHPCAPPHPLAGCSSPAPGLRCRDPSPFRVWCGDITGSAGGLGHPALGCAPGERPSPLAGLAVPSSRHLPGCHLPGLCRGERLKDKPCQP